MNHRDRLEAVVNGKTIDSPLMSLWKHFPMEDRNPISFIDRVIAFQEQTQSDFIKICHNGLYSIEDWGSIIQWPDAPNRVGKVVKYGIQSSGDWENLRSLSVYEGALAREILVTKQIVKSYKGQVPVQATIFSPLTTAIKMCGDSIFTHMKDSPASLHKGLEIITETTVQFVKEAIKQGVDGFFFASQLATRDILSPNDYELFGKHYDLAVLDQLKGQTWFNIMHLHGLQPMFDELESYPVEAISWHDRITSLSLKDGREKTNKILVGGIDDGILANGTEEQIRDHLQDAVLQVGDNKLILGPGCVIPLHIPDNTLASIRKLAAHLKRDIA